MKILLLIVALAAVLAVGCGQDRVVAKKLHAESVGTAPQTADIVGTYTLSAQTVVPGGMSALGGRQCKIEVRSGGGFSITNYPQGSGGRFTSFISATGTWQLAIVGTSYGHGTTPKDCWGLRFSASGKRIEPTAFMGPEQPFGLLTILGDPDSSLTLRFRKEGQTTE